MAECLLVDLGNVTGHPSRIMDGSFVYQVLAKTHLWDAKFVGQSPADKAANLWLRILPKKLGEVAAADMVAGFGGVMTKLTSTQDIYINVPSEGPIKPERYKY